jgi:hypothetical protein
MRSAAALRLGLAALLALGASVLAARAGEVEVMSSGKVIKPDSTFYVPMNSRSSKVALFSESRPRFSVYNKTGAALEIEGLQLERCKEAAEEEFTLQTTDLKPKTLKFEKTSVEPKKSYDFIVRYYPVQSKRLTAKITVTYGGGKKTSWTVSAAGRSKALFTEKFATKMHKVLGGAKTDEMITGMVADKDGNCFVAGQVTGLADRFAYDIFYARINADGKLAWAKLWNGPFRDYSRDPGQNAETGGSSNAIDIDEEGFVYLTGAVSPGKTNNNYASLVMKIDPKTGEPVWEKLWRPEWPEKILDKHGCEAYALDVNGGHVYVVGTTGAGVDGSNALIFLMSLSAKDGSVEMQRYIDPTPKTTDRAYCVRADGKGNVYVGGLVAGKYGFLARFKDLHGDAPKVAWAKKVNCGWGSNLNYLDVDKEGNVYCSLDRRGARTYFSFIKMDPEGKLVWGKTYDGGSNKNNNTSFVKVVGENLYVGGRTGQGWYDSQMGDGKLLKVRCKDGKELWSAFYFTGKGPDELGEHRAKGIAVRGKKIYLLGQVYSGSLNGVRFWGYWYQGVSKLSAYKPSISPIKAPEDPENIAKGAVKDAKAARKLLDMAKLVPWRDAPAKTDAHPPDGELIYWQLEEK